MVKTTNRHLMLSLFLAIALATAALVTATLLARPALAATITVNTTTDEDNTDGDCSLREAVIAANTNTERDACAAGSGSDIITVPAGTYTLSILDATPRDATVGDLDVTGTTSITGAGARATTIQGGTGFDDRIFENTGTTTISGLTITGGNPAELGGGVRNQGGALTLRQVAVTENTTNVAGGVYGEGGTLNITDSSVSSNQAGSVGGVLQRDAITGGGTANIVNSTISGNQAVACCGSGVYAADTATVSVESSTIASNTTPFPGGGIFISGTSAAVNVKNSIVSDNTTNNCDTGGGAINSQGNNISSDGSCGFTQTTDKQDTDPLLGSLQNNGGPTDIHALLTGSPATDSGDSAQPADQRGVTRPQDGDNNGSAIDDIGAFELVQASPQPPPPKGKKCKGKKGKAKKKCKKRR